MPDGYDLCQPLANTDSNRRYFPVCETINGQVRRPDQTRGARDVCVWQFDGPCSGAQVPNCQ